MDIFDVSTAISKKKALMHSGVNEHDALSTYNGRTPATSKLNIVPHHSL
jgi:hypothetical protein